MKPLKVYNSLSKRKEDFVPIRPQHIGIYVCGPTVYDHSHIGHGRTYIAFDVVVRYLKHLGYGVTYVRNYTDVDDKIINRALKEGVQAGVISERFVEEFKKEASLLRLIPP